MNITAYIKECERAQRESETEEQRRQRRRAAKPQKRRHAYAREVLPSGCVLCEMTIRNELQ